MIIMYFLLPSAQMANSCYLEVVEERSAFGSWEAATGSEVTSMDYGDRIYFVALSPDARHIISGGLHDHDLVRIWISRPAACAYLPSNLTRSQWEKYIGDALPYQVVCPNLPIESKTTPTP